MIYIVIVSAIIVGAMLYQIMKNSHEIHELKEAQNHADRN